MGKDRKTRRAFTHVLRNKGGNVIFWLCREFICLLHRDKVLDQNSPQFVVKLAVNLFQFF